MTITSVMPCQISLLINLTMSHVMFKQLLQPVFKASNIAICLTALMFAKGASVTPPQFSSL